jgi:hypothetical protein
MSEFITIKIVYNKELRLFINKLKEIGLKNKGILFGGLVRCDIIGCHYRKEFFKKKLNYSKYWDKEYDVSTNKRTIIPTDMDIYFKDEEAIANFINGLNSYIRLFNGSIRIVENNISTRYLSLNNNIRHKKIYISIRIGNIISYGGIVFKFSIDALYSINTTSLLFNKNIEPPFNNLDFLCNVFLMEHVNDNTIVRISNCSGTPIDAMSYYDKAKITNKIMEDIINGKTSFVRNNDHFNSEYINSYRIIKMLDYDWDIDNLPFKIVNATNITELDECTCCICQDTIEKTSENKIIEINTYVTKSYYLHYSCFINHLKSENRKKYVNTDNNLIECRCPMRIPFNFKECYKLISYDI